MSVLHAVQVRYACPRRYVGATSVDQALDLLAANPGARIVAGGTDLLLEIDRGARRDVELLIDVSRIAEARQIRIDEDAAALGPMVTHNDVVRDALLVKRALPLAQACWEVGSPQLRNRATIAGNLITASPANDTISPLLALGAKVELSSLGGVRVVPVEAFITGFRTTCLQPDEMITRVLVPLLRPNQRGIYVKLGNRCAQAISVVHVAIVVSFDESENVIDARIALGSVAPTVVLAPLASSALIGHPLRSETIGAAAQLASESVTPIGDVRATADYRQDTIVVVVRRGRGPDG